MPKPHRYIILNIFYSEDVELRRIFPNEFPFDTIRKTGSLDPEVGIILGMNKLYVKKIVSWRA